MDLAELLPAGLYTCWRIVSTTQFDARGWVTDNSAPYLTRGGAIASAAAIRAQIDDSRGRAQASPWHQVNVASSANILLDGEPEVGDITWENTWGETVAVKRSSLIVGA